MKKSLFTALAVGLGLTVNFWAQVPSYVPTNGLVGYWPFNGNANDESGNGNNGTVNGATLTLDRNGNSSKAFSFDGISNNIVIPNSNSLNVTELTVTVWYQANGDDMTVITKNDPSNCTQHSYALHHQFIWQSFGPGLYTSTGYGNCGGTARQEHWGVAGVVPSNQWVFVVYTIDSFGTSRTYLNGILLESYNGQNITSCNSPSATLRFGGPHWNTYNMFSGKIDDIGIWNRALTQQEITNLYNGCSASTITSQPTNQTVNPTTSAQFVVNATSVSLFQWQTDLGLGFQNVSNAGQYNGTNNDTLVVSNATVSNNNQQFRCVVNSGSCADTSNIAILTVSAANIEELISQGNFNLYPNPTQSSFEIQTNLLFNKIEIRDMQGRVVKTENSGKIINIASLQKGTYLVQLIDEKSKVIAVQRIIKE